jgi:mannose-1-phosphate guanylyltransferase
MVVLPADHVILDVAQFHQTLKRAVEVAQQPDTLVTIGIEPTHPETGYGYIHYAAQGVPGVPPVYPVRQFTEKPDEETALQFLETGEYLWNSGMFIWRTDTIIEAFERYQPVIHEAFGSLRAGGEKVEQVVEAFEQCPKISIDYAIMEHAERVYVVPGSFGWNDVGDWRAVYALQPKDATGNAVQGEAMVLDSKGCLIHAGDRLVVLVGVEDVMVVDTADALLVCDRSCAQKVKDVTTYLTEHKPWFT